jgi:hypothetical protein
MFIQGDNGTLLKLHIKEKDVPLDLSGATVEVTIKAGMRKFTKTAQITGTGEAEVELTSDDVSTVGLYYAQAIVQYDSENTYSSDVQQFYVGAKL